MPKNYVPLRDWASASYDPKTGKAASAFRPEGASFGAEGFDIRPSAQVDSARSKGRGNAPGFVEWQKDHNGGGS
jgi:hypothetical protein